MKPKEQHHKNRALFDLLNAQWSLERAGATEQAAAVAAVVRQLQAEFAELFAQGVTEWQISIPVPVKTEEQP